MADDKGKFIIFQCCRHSSDKWQFCARYLSVGMIFVDGPIYNDVDWIDDVWWCLDSRVQYLLNASQCTYRIPYTAHTHTQCADAKWDGFLSAT